MLAKLSQSISENIQTYLAAYYSKYNISQSFTMEIHKDNACRLDIVFSEGPLEAEVISYINGRFQYKGKYLAVVSEESMNVDEKSSSFLLEDGFVLCTKYPVMGVCLPTWERTKVLHQDAEEIDSFMDFYLDSPIDWEPSYLNSIERQMNGARQESNIVDCAYW